MVTVTSQDRSRYREKGGESGPLIALTCSMAKPILASRSGKRPNSANARAGAALVLMQAMQIVSWLLTCSNHSASDSRTCSASFSTLGSHREFVALCRVIIAVSFWQTVHYWQSHIHRSPHMILLFPATGRPMSSMLESLVNRHSLSDDLCPPCRFVGIVAGHPIGTVPSTSGAVVKHNPSCCSLLDCRLAELLADCSQILVTSTRCILHTTSRWQRHH